MTLRKSILIALDNVYPLLLPEKSLHVDVNCLLEEPATLSELRTELAELEALRFVSGMRGLDGILKWRLTDNGKAELLSN
ncbi:MAG: hypothetical protein N2487_01710 [Verrucomicrobiae bacterium]|nr:hypothetical protein [Verrucomicrobiae bacterium]